MPTGYTAGISKGQNFEDFIMGCARAFGACIMMRDEPHDKPIPEKFEESNYHEESYNESVAELTKLQKMTNDEADKESEKEYNQQMENQKKHLDRIDKQESLYESMLEKVNQWTPPSQDHVKLKEFMIQQIYISMDKGSMRRYYSENKVVKLSGEQWKHQKIKSAEHDIEYHMKEWMEETKRTADQNKWVKLLRDSIK